MRDLELCATMLEEKNQNGFGPCSTLGLSQALFEGAKLKKKA